MLSIHKKNMSLTLIHSVSKTHPSTILQAIPATRYFALISFEERGNKYHTILLTDKDDASVWGYYAPYKEIFPVYPSKNTEANRLYWKGKSPKPFICSFLKVMNMEKVDVSYKNRFDSGYITYPSDFDMLPWLLGGIRVWSSISSSDASCRYAFPKNSNKTVEYPKENQGEDQPPNGQISGSKGQHPNGQANENQSKGKYQKSRRVGEYRKSDRVSEPQKVNEYRKSDQSKGKYQKNRRVGEYRKSDRVNENPKSEQSELVSEQVSNRQKRNQSAITHVLVDPSSLKTKVKISR